MLSNYIVIYIYIYSSYANSWNVILKKLLVVLYLLDSFSDSYDFMVKTFESNSVFNLLIYHEGYLGLQIYIYIYIP